MNCHQASLSVIKTARRLSDYFTGGRIVGGRLDVVDGVLCRKWKTSFLLFKKSQWRVYSEYLKTREKEIFHVISQNEKGCSHNASLRRLAFREVGKLLPEGPY